MRLRWPIFTLVAFILISAYNGQWRLGRDSSLYRDVARNLASGKGYIFRGQRERHIYPGLPYLLAGIDKVFGRQDPLRPTAALIIMIIISLLTLVMVYLLVRTYFPPWVAVAVTTGVGINHDYLQMTHEIMTDLPFLLGVCMTLLGIARIAKPTTPQRRVGWIAMIVIGAVIAVSMRPTFWALVLAWIGACFVGLLGSRRRLAWGIGIATAAAIVLLWIVLDPRSPGHGAVGGRYEQKVFSTLKHLGNVQWGENLAKFSTKHLPEAFFGLEMPMPWGPILTSVLLAASILLIRKSPLWGLYVLITALMTIVLGSATRYFLMILPLLLVGWASFADWISQVSSRWYRAIPFAGELVLLFWLGLATGPHLVRDSGFILEQHGYAKDRSHKSFMEVYRDGSGVGLVAISKLISERVPPKAIVFGIEGRGSVARITTYLSGRNVYHPAEILKGLRQGQWLTALAKSKASWIFFEGHPSGKGSGILISKLIKTQGIVLVPGSEIKNDRWVLARITISEKLVRQHPTTRPATTQPKPTTRPRGHRKRPH